MTYAMKSAIADFLRWLANKLDPPEIGGYGGTD